MQDYDVIGFDADHCFVKYNVFEMAKLVVQSYLDDLHDSQGYPKEITDFNFDKHLSVMLNNAVWDIENGTILKLAEEGKITHAVHGYEKLDYRELTELYGNPPVYRKLAFPKSNR